MIGVALRAQIGRKQRPKSNHDRDLILLVCRLSFGSVFDLLLDPAGIHCYSYFNIIIVVIIIIYIHFIIIPSLLCPLESGIEVGKR